MKIKTPIIFLDLDGVMNSGEYFKIRKKVISERGEHFHDIDPEAITLLNDMVESTGADVVLSSSWRATAFDSEILYKCGFKGNVIDTTPTVKGVRGQEIMKWIEENTDGHHFFKRYVIFDDDGDMLWWQRNHFFNTTFESGLTSSIAYRATNFLKAQRNLNHNEDIRNKLTPIDNLIAMVKDLNLDNDIINDEAELALQKLRYIEKYG